MNYIFGYGSLICSDSRARTGIGGQATPIRVRGIKRTWSLHTPDWPATAVSASQDLHSTCNGVFFEVDDANLIKFDEREAGYQRIALDWSQVTLYSSIPLIPKGTLWVYVGESVAKPSENRPIYQSYLDVIMNGCFSISPVFATEFLVHTSRWSHLINDRDDPQYLRPLKKNTNHSITDSLLTTHHPSLMAQRKSYCGR